MPMDRYTLPQAARRAGVTVHQARTYLTMRLVAACSVSESGGRLFNEACVERLRLIASATRAGLLLNDIAPLIRALDTGQIGSVAAARTTLCTLLHQRRDALHTLDQLMARACRSTGKASVRRMAS